MNNVTRETLELLKESEHIITYVVGTRKDGNPKYIELVWSVNYPRYIVGPYWVSAKEFTTLDNAVDYYNSL